MMNSVNHSVTIIEKIIEHSLSAHNSVSNCFLGLG